MCDPIARSEGAPPLRNPALRLKGGVAPLNNPHRETAFRFPDPSNRIGAGRAVLDWSRLMNLHGHVCQPHWIFECADQ